MAKILIIEDDNQLREIYESRMQAAGHTVVSAGDGEAGIKLAIQEKPDLIVSDVMMPKLSGFDMLDNLRAIDETKNTKVIVMTALSQTEDRERAEKLGADRYIVKSQVTVDDIARVIEEVLNERENSPAQVNANTTPTTDSNTSTNLGTPTINTAPVTTPTQQPINTATPSPSMQPPTTITAAPPDQNLNTTNSTVPYTENVTDQEAKSPITTTTSDPVPELNMTSPQQGQQESISSSNTEQQTLNDSEESAIAQQIEKLMHQETSTTNEDKPTTANQTNAQATDMATTQPTNEAHPPVSTIQNPSNVTSFSAPTSSQPQSLSNQGTNPINTKKEKILQPLSSIQASSNPAPPPVEAMPASNVASQPSQFHTIENPLNSGSFVLSTDTATTMNQQATEPSMNPQHDNATHQDSTTSIPFTHISPSTEPHTTAYQPINSQPNINTNTDNNTSVDQNIPPAPKEYTDPEEREAAELLRAAQLHSQQTHTPPEIDIPTSSSTGQDTNEVSKQPAQPVDHAVPYPPQAPISEQHTPQQPVDNTSSAPQTQPQEQQPKPPTQQQNVIPHTNGVAVDGMLPPRQDTPHHNT